jgi:ribose transport system substrate-binding protein
MKTDKTSKGSPASRWRWFCTLAVLLGLLVAAGCGDDDDSSSGGGEDQDYEIVFIPGVAGDDFFHTIWLGAQERAKKVGASIEQQAPPKYEPASQIPLVNAAIAKKPDALLVAATDADALRAPLKTASDRGIKVLTFDTGVTDPSFVVTHVSSDIVDAGRIVGTELVRLVGENGELMYIDHAPGVAFAKDLRSGFEEVVKSTPGVTLLPVQYSEIEPQKANTITRTTVTSHPNLAGAFVGVGVNAQGAVPALKAAHKLDQVKTVAFDAFADNMKFLTAGELNAVVSVAARDYGHELVDLAVDSLDGKDVPPSVKPKICVLTAENQDDPENKPCLYSAAPG